MGCSTTTNINLYSSKEEFYEVVNKSIEDKDIKVVLLNDTTINFGHGGVVENDTLFVIRESEEIKHISLALSDLEKLKYKDDNKNTAYILRKNGEEFNCKNISTYNDSIYFVTSKTVQKRKNVMSVNEVKIISYKTRLTPALLGIIAGAAIGLIPGLTRSKDDPSKFISDPNGCINNQVTTCCILIGVPIIGAVVGGIIGVSVGYEYNYQFNP